MTNRRNRRRRHRQHKARTALRAGRLAFAVPAWVLSNLQAELSTSYASWQQRMVCGQVSAADARTGWRRDAARAAIRAYLTGALVAGGVA